MIQKNRIRTILKEVDDAICFWEKTMKKPLTAQSDNIRTYFSYYERLSPYLDLPSQISMLRNLRNTVKHIEAWANVGFDSNMLLHIANIPSKDVPDILQAVLISGTEIVPDNTRKEQSAYIWWLNLYHSVRYSDNISNDELETEFIKEVRLLSHACSKAPAGFLSFFLVVLPLLLIGFPLATKEEVLDKIKLYIICRFFTSKRPELLERLSTLGT